MPITIGFRLGPYEILALIGAGGMGEVYRARDTRLERTVAVKVLPGDLSSSPEGRQRFEREAKTISQISHPHICALYDVGREGETDYLVMELLEGETLSERLYSSTWRPSSSTNERTERGDRDDRSHSGEGLLVTRMRIPASLAAATLLAGSILAAGCASSQPAAPAKPAPPRCRGTLGMEVVPPSRPLRKTLALPPDFRGAIVSEVLPGGPAAAAGIRVNDVVEEIGASRISNDCDADVVLFNRACEPVRILLRRAGAAVDVTLVPVDQDAFLEKSCRDGIGSACFRQVWAGWDRRSAREGRDLDRFDAACKLGSADACAYQGLQLIDSNSRGDEAIAVLGRACDLGDGGGCANLAFLYATGKFVAKDDRRATAFYVKSCDRGDAQGCYNVGLMADDARGGPADLAIAVARYEEGCDLGSSTACTNLGFLYEHGRGVKADPARAVALYQQGCEGTKCQPSNLGGCVNVGRAYRDGIGVEKSEPRAATIFREACDRKSNPDDIHADENGARACSLLGGLYLAGDGVEKDLDQGRELSELGCGRGDSFGCFNAAAVYAAGSGVGKDPEKAASFLDQACKGGDAEGCYDLGIAFQKGNGVLKDASRAAELIKKACELGFADACPKKKKKKKG